MPRLELRLQANLSFEIDEVEGKSKSINRPAVSGLHTSQFYGDRIPSPPIIASRRRLR